MAEFKRGCEVKLDRLDGLSVDDVCTVYDWLIEKLYRQERNLKR